MTSETLKEVLQKLNRKMRSEKRHIILFMDNAGCHPTDDQLSYSNIKIVFLPPNTTSCLQPLDAGIINFKVHYRKLLLKFVVSRVNDGSTSPEIAKTVDVLQAIRWIKQAWQDVSREVITTCFNKCGISPSICQGELCENTDLFEELEPLVKGANDEITAEQFICADDEVPTSVGPVDTSRMDWCNVLRDEALTLCKTDDDEPTFEEFVEEDSGTLSDHEKVDYEPPESTIKRIAEAIAIIDNLQRFASLQLKDDDVMVDLMKV